MQYRNYNPAGVTVISVDEAGNLLRDEPVKFDYNRELAFRIPVQDATGKPVGESTRGPLNVFTDGGGKKAGPRQADVDPDDSP